MQNTHIPSTASSGDNIIFWVPDRRHLLLLTFCYMPQLGVLRPSHSVPWESHGSVDHSCLTLGFVVFEIRFRSNCWTFHSNGFVSMDSIREDREKCVEINFEKVVHTFHLKKKMNIIISLSAVILLFINILCLGSRCT